MSRNFRLLLPIAMLLIVFACQDRSKITEPNTTTSGITNQNSTPPDLITAVTLDSAIFSIYVDGVTNQTITAHNILADWAENTVTWNSFGEAFDPTSLGSYMSSAVGFHSINITPLAQAWLDGTTSNFGILLKQDVGGLTSHLSSEAPIVATHPMLQLFFTGGVVDTVQRGTSGDVFDTYIREIEPDVNFGSDVYIYTGVVDNFRKQILVKFGLPTPPPPPPPPPSGCTRTIGFWKTHAGFGPQADVVTPLLPVWLGTSGGVKSLDVTTALIAYNVFNQNVYGTPSNGITKLYAQLLGAKLNIESGASDASVAATIAAADAFLATHNWLDWAGLSTADKNMVLGWQSTLDDYNNGLIGPLHCDD